MNQKNTPKKQSEKPPDHELKIKISPLLREVYICDFQPAEYAHSGEFYKTQEKKQRPVVVISKTNKREGIVTVLPMTRAKQKERKYAAEITSPLDGKESSVVCSHPMTVATTRLEPPRKYYPLPKVSEDDFTEIMTKFHNHICGYYFPLDVQNKLAKIVGSKQKGNQAVLDAILANAQIQG